VRKSFLVFLILAVGCSANSGVVSIGADTFMVSRQAATGFSGTGTLKTDAIVEANLHCQGINKGMKLIHASEASPPFILGNFPKAEITFMCLDKNDPEYTRLTNSEISGISKKDAPMPVTVNPAPIIVAPPSPTPPYSAPVFQEVPRFSNGTHCTARSLGNTTYMDCN
jgi:hypothetical protein